MNNIVYIAIQLKKMIPKATQTQLKRFLTVSNFAKAYKKRNGERGTHRNTILRLIKKGELYGYDVIKIDNLYFIGVHFDELKEIKEHLASLKK